DQIDVLVDKDRLKPSDDWNHRLNLWLQECHAAIILFSKRAIENSAWVAKEATILSWRAELNPKFKLFPVMLKGETTPDDLKRVCSGVLQIDRFQCVHDAQEAKDILDGIAEALDALKDLAKLPLTPMEILQEGIAKILDQCTEASLRLALEDICGRQPETLADKKACANRLAQLFLETKPDNPTLCFATFQQGLGPLKPLPCPQEAIDLLKLVRSLWVEPDDAAALRLAKIHRHHVALNGHCISAKGPDNKTRCYTLERYIERAWPLSKDKFLIVSLTGAKPLEQIQQEIRDNCLGLLPPCPLPNADQLSDQAVNEDVRTIIVLIPAYKDKGGLPDPDSLKKLLELFAIYNKIMLVFDLRDEHPELPPTVKYAQHKLRDKNAMKAFLDCESLAYRRESAVKTYLNNLY
ncbi:MAG: toll/interleukin-1 receptor domain-containing protein, partial [Candidatus Methylumidiphilus sp.]